MSVNEFELSRFSTVAYANKLKGMSTAAQAQTRILHQFEAGEEPNEFNEIVEIMRGFLVAAKGRTEEDKRRYQETLNRAVLGFEDDRHKVLTLIKDQLSKQRLQDSAPPNSKYHTLAEALFAEIIGLNVLELLLRHREGLEEIQVVGTRIFEVRQGAVIPSAYQFSSMKEVERIQQNLVLFNQDTLNPRKRWAEVMLRDGSRVTMTGFGFTAEPTLTIRFYIVNRLSLPMLCQPQYETMNETMLELIRTVIHSYFNMIVIGPTNSGKTSLIKAFIEEMPDHERVITIESRLELMLKRDFPHKNIIEYEIGDDDLHHGGRQAFKLALRQSPRRICHAEIRDLDANIYVRACTRGHEGSVTSIHANELEDVPDAITDMCMLDERGMDPVRLRKRITEFVTQIGFEMAVVEGKRRIVRVGEFGYQDGEVTVREIVKYNSAAKIWEFPEPFSDNAAKRITKHSLSRYQRMLALGMVRPC